MRTLRLTLAYDGTRYVGWQRQPNGPSVQAALERAIEQLTGSPGKVAAAGRTDAGVHALGQVASFQTESAIPCRGFHAGLQKWLPGDIVIRDVADAGPEFSARFSAKRKRYRYVIHNAPVSSPFLRHYSTFIRAPLDAEAMHTAAQLLVGTHDFRSFESQFPNKATSVRTVFEATVGRYGGWPVWHQPDSLAQPALRDGEFLWFDIVADGFLYNMVRAIMGTLMNVGRGKWPVEEVGRIVALQDRVHAGDTAPPQGLYLVAVEY